MDYGRAWYFEFFDLDILNNIDILNKLTMHDML